jgi:hypothetical protein
VLGVTKTDDRWYVYVSRNDAGPERTDVDATEMWTGTQETDWTRCRLPEEIRSSPLQWNVTFAAFRGAIVTVIGQTVLRSTAPDTFEVLTRTNPLCKEADGRLFVVGDTLYESHKHTLNFTKDLSLWTSRQTLRPSKGVSTSARIAGIRDGEARRPEA